MPAKYWFRVFFMCLSLVGVVVLISHLKTKTPKPGGPARASLKLCHTRISKIELHSGLKIYQVGINWFREMDGGRQELAPVAVEKWLSRNCQVSAVVNGVLDSLSPPPVLATFSYVDGEALELYQRADNHYVFWDFKVFESPQLDQALKELATLPAAP